MNKPLKTIELFGGIGAMTQTLNKLNISHEIVDYVEIDKYAVKSYNVMNGTSFEPQDITMWDKDIEVDLIMHGSPCQDFSIAGKQAGGDIGSGTRSSLLYETVRIVQKLKPKYVIWENVKNVLSKKHRHNFDMYLAQLEEFGYKNYYQVLNAKDYGIPQNRERVFTISILGEHDSYVFPQKQELKLKLKDILEDEVDEKYFLSDKAIRGINNSKFKAKQSIIQDNEGICSTLLSRDYRDPKCILVKEATKKGYAIATVGDSINLEHPNSTTRRGRIGHQVAQTLTTSCNQAVMVIDEEEYRIRKLTPLECWRLMGFNDEVFNKARQVNSNSQLYKQAGNSIVVNVLESILNNLFCKEVSYEI